MGQAKRKGTKSERVEAAIQRQQDAMAAVLAQQPELLDEDRLRNRQTLKDIHNGKATTPEAKEALHKQRMMMSMNIGLINGAMRVLNAQRRDLMPPPIRPETLTQPKDEG